jgi:S-adenosylmethionine hydrolase
MKKINYFLFATLFLVALFSIFCSTPRIHATPSLPAVVLQTDFGLKDAAVCSMKGILFQQDPLLRIFDLTHDIPEYQIWEAAFRLNQGILFWPKHTIFVSVVDPGVGTERKSVVALTKTGHYIVTPDNGTLTLVADTLGLEEVREMDETQHRRPDSLQSYTFYGRDLYAYTAGRLASHKISFEQIGPSRGTTFVAIPYQKAQLQEGVLSGTLPVLDPQYGNVWSNIPQSLFQKLNPQIGESFAVRIFHQGQVKYKGRIPYQHTFGDVPLGEPLLYLNSLLEVSLALNMKNFSQTHQIASGPEWTIQIQKMAKK